MNSDDPHGNTEQPEEIVIPVVEEEVTAETKAVKTGSVRVDKHVETRVRRIETPLLHDEVEIRRVPVNRVVEEAPPVRRRGDATVIPVVEEELVITKRLVLKEEVHLIRRRIRTPFVKDVEVDRERAEIHRLDAEGRVVDKPRPRPLRRTARGSVLD